MNWQLQMENGVIVIVLKLLNSFGKFASLQQKKGHAVKIESYFSLLKCFTGISGNIAAVRM